MAWVNADPWVQSAPWAEHDAALALSATAALSGSGTLSATAVASRSATAALSGAGTLSTSETASRNTVAALSGSGTLSAAATAARSASAALSGSGTLSASSVANRSATAALSGSGTLSGAGVAARVVGATYSGEGTLTAVVLAARSVSADLGGSGTLSASAVLEITPVPPQLVKHFYGVGGNAVDNATLTTSTAGENDNPFNQVNGTPSQRIIDGKIWVRVSNDTTTHQWRYNGLNLPEWMIQFEFIPGDTAPAAMAVLLHATHSGGQLFRLQYNPNRTVSLANSAGSVIAAGSITPALALGMNRYRFVLWSPAGQDSVQARCYGPDGQLFWTRNQALGTTNALTQTIWGRQSGGAYGPGYFGNFEIHNTAAERGAVPDLITAPMVYVYVGGVEKAGSMFVYSGGVEKSASPELYTV